MSSFFFQAEDGIRDVAVTGVQTCALPIFCSRFGKGARHMLAEPPARTSDDGDSAAEIKQTVSHETSPGRRTTFITLGSRACKRSNQRGPSSSGAIAVMRFFT